jgi:tRNA pseudouridine38-40 synthase
VIKNANTPPAIGFNNCLWIKQTLNTDKMNKAAQHLLGEKDFSAFRASGCQSKSSIREIVRAKIICKGDYIYFFIKGNAFMLNMVRIIMGTLLDVGTNKIKITDFKEIIQQKDRKKAGKTISPKGLYFLGPEYNDLNYQKGTILDELD